MATVPRQMSSGTQRQTLTRKRLILPGYFAYFIFNSYAFILIGLWQENMLRAESRRLKTSTRSGGESGLADLRHLLTRFAQTSLNILKCQIPKEELSR